MSLMGTLAKVAIGYATARGVDKVAQGGGLGALLGGTQADAGAGGAAAQNPMEAMMAQMQGMMGGAGGAAGGGMDLQAMLGGLMGGGAQGSDAADQGGLLSSLGNAGQGAGMAGMFAAMAGAASSGGQGIGSMLDQFGKAGATPPQAEETAALMLRAMIQAAKSDGDIDDAERAKILETVGDDADAEDIAFVQAQLAAPVDVEALAADTPAGMGPQVYSMSLMSIRVDTPAEKAYMDALGNALEIDPTMQAMLKMQMGVSN